MLQLKQRSGPGVLVFSNRWNKGKCESGACLLITTGKIQQILGAPVLCI